jgi:hypothetical protein
MGLTLNAEHGSRVCESKTLKRIFGSNIQKVIGGSREVHNEKPHNIKYTK